LWGPVQETRSLDWELEELEVELEVEADSELGPGLDLLEDSEGVLLLLLDLLDFLHHETSSSLEPGLDLLVLDSVHDEPSVELAVEADSELGPGLDLLDLLDWPHHDPS